MLRLRTTAGLSVLAAAIGVAGTGWLSTLTAGWPGQPARGIAVNHHATTHLPAHQARRGHGPVSVVMHRRPHPVTMSFDHLAGAQAATVNVPTELVPLATPSDDSQPWYQLRDHLDGHVVLHLTIDGHGRVTGAALRNSSGDPILDRHALRSVQRWRFAVRSDQPDGLSGDLTMRFASRSAEVARAR